MTCDEWKIHSEGHRQKPIGCNIGAEPNEPRNANPVHHPSMSECIIGNSAPKREIRESNGAPDRLIDPDIDKIPYPFHLEVSKSRYILNEGVRQQRQAATPTKYRPRRL